MTKAFSSPGTLYDIGFDLPETHVIRKDRKVCFAFFAGDWKSRLQLRGLDIGQSLTESRVAEEP
jgi:hypothetical protein